MSHPPFELHVCLTCADPDIDRRRKAEGGGADLLAAIRAEVARRPWKAACTLLAFECLGACQRRGRVSISCPGKWGVVFGGLDDRSDAAPLCDYIGAWLARRNRRRPANTRIAAIATRRRESAVVMSASCECP